MQHRDPVNNHSWNRQHSSSKKNEDEEKEPMQEPFRLGIPPIVSGLNVKKSLIPLEAIYNPEIDKFKRAEVLSEVNPTPLSLLILKDKSQQYEYRLINEERGVTLSHRQGSTYGKATFLNST